MLRSLSLGVPSPAALSQRPALRLWRHSRRSGRDGEQRVASYGGCCEGQIKGAGGRPERLSIAGGGERSRASPPHPKWSPPGPRKMLTKLG